MDERDDMLLKGEASNVGPEPEMPTEANPLEEGSVVTDQDAIEYPHPDQLRGHMGEPDGVCPTCGRELHPAEEEDR